MAITADPIKVQDLDINYILDIKTAVTFMGLPSVYFTMLETYESMSLKPHMPLLAKELVAQNWLEYRNQAHALKGPAGYVGASRLHYACYYI
jgi:HPt (histidine-containing phosphotransfer) domain-containing protein